jgi:hypothetical protein
VGFELAGKYGIKVIAMEVTHEAHRGDRPALERLGRPTGVMLQIGTRNTQNFELLKALGRQQRFPILLKRGFGITLNESLNAAEYLASEGNSQCDLLPARHEERVWRAAPQSGRLQSRAGGQAPHPHAGVRRPVALGRLARQRPRWHPRRLPRHGAGRDRRRQHGAGRLPSAAGRGTGGWPAGAAARELPNYLADIALCRQSYLQRKALWSQSA